MTFNGIQAVLFDMDETLIHNTRTFEDVARETYDAFSEALDPLSFDEYWATLWDKAVDMWCMMVDGALPGDVARRYTFINTLRVLDADPALAPRLLEHTDARILASTQILPDTVPVLTRLRREGYRLGIVTNGFSCIQRMKIDRHRLDGLVDFALVSEEVGAHKPDPAIFGEALARAACMPECAVFVGDTLENDYTGARTAGLEAILIDHDGTRADYPVESGRYIHCLGELLPMLGLRA